MRQAPRGKRCARPDTAASKCGAAGTVTPSASDALGLVLEHRGLPTEPPRVALARGPAHADDNMDQRPLFGAAPPEPDPGFEFV